VVLILVNYESVYVCGYLINKIYRQKKLVIFVAVDRARKHCQNRDFYWSCI